MRQLRATDPGVRVVDNTVVDEPSTGASGKRCSSRGPDIPDSAEVQIMKVTTRED